MKCFMVKIAVRPLLAKNLPEFTQPQEKNSTRVNTLGRKRYIALNIGVGAEG